MIFSTKYKPRNIQQQGEEEMFLKSNRGITINTCDVGFSTNYRLRNLQQQSETWDGTKMHILEIEIMANTPISFKYVHSLYLEP